MNQNTELPPEPLKNPVHPVPDAVIFDMDGVVTDTAAVHAQAWKKLFDAALPDFGDTVPFDADVDYRAHVDGKAREDGVRDFLASRDIAVEQAALSELAARKQAYFDEALTEHGVEVFDDALALIKRLREDGIPLALVTSSRNSEAVLGSAGLLDVFDVRVDGNTARDNGLPGKPAPDMFLHAASLLDAQPSNTVVLEDATSGVAAAVYRKLCKKACAKVQVYANRSDLPGGSTLGSIASTLVPVEMADIGLAQLAMHSCFETAGVDDLLDLVNICRTQFESGLEKSGDVIHLL